MKNSIEVTTARKQAFRAQPVSVKNVRLGGAGAVEMLRGNRLDIFGGLEDILPPRDYFELSPEDKAAADQLTANLIVPQIIYPFRQFIVKWEVSGPAYALARVNSYQMNIYGVGPVFNLPSEQELTSNGWVVRGSMIVSMWQSGPLNLWARFGSGIKDLSSKMASVDLSHCETKRFSLDLLTTLLQTSGANEFIERIRKEAGDDVTVSVTQGATATHSADGIDFSMKIRLTGSGATLDVSLSMKFMVVPKDGHLGSSFNYPGSRNVVIDADLPLLDDIWHTITLGSHSMSEYYTLFTNGLKAFADEFAAAVARNVRGLPDTSADDYESKEASAPKIVLTEIDSSTDELVIALCPIQGRIRTIAGVFADTLQILDN